MATIALVAGATSKVLKLAGAVMLAGSVVLAHSTGYFSAFGASGDALGPRDESPNYDAGEFQNLEPTDAIVGTRGLSIALDYLASDPARTPDAPLVVATDTVERLSESPSDELRLTWLGHASMLIEIDGRRLLTDPVFGERASPSTLVGPVRYAPSPIEVERMPPVDAVLITSDRYGHLEERAARKLGARGMRFVVPLGVGAHLASWGIPEEQIVELDWWEELGLGEEFDVVLTPARYGSGRVPWSENETLWGSFVVRGEHHRIFVAGGTGYDRSFSDVGSRYGPFQVAALPLGGDPAFAHTELSPANALAAKRDLDAELLMPIGWGTYATTLGPWDGPIEEVVALSKRDHVPLLLPRIGEPTEPGDYPTFEPWWRSGERPPGP